MPFIDNDDGPFLISQIPNLQLISLLVVECHCNLSWYVFTPANDYISLTRTCNWAISELENGFVSFDVPKSYQPIRTRRCKDMSNLSVPGYRCYIWALMWILLSRFYNLRVWVIWANIQKQDLGWTECEKVLFNAIPFCAHDRECIVTCFFCVNERGLRFDVIHIWLFRERIGCNHLRWVPKWEGSIFHSSKNQTIW